MNTESILIAGGTGFIGGHLSDLLLQRGHDVAHLSRHKGKGDIRTFRWSPRENTIDPEALRDRTVIINLSGANVGRRWTTSYKEEIRESRTLSTHVLREAIKANGARVHTYISAGGISIYGSHDGSKTYSEDDPAAGDFLARVCVAWEEEAARLASETGVRLVILRAGPVLSGEGGLLEEFARPVRWFVGAPLGTGDQYISWIHMEDVCRMYAFALGHRNLQGTFNAVAPVPVTNRELTRSIARSLNRPLLLPAVPEFALRLLLGEMASMAVGGCRVSPGKIMEAGFSFEFDTLAKAMDDIF